jgi:hypothetical protein
MGLKPTRQIDETYERECRFMYLSWQTYEREYRFH